MNIERNLLHSCWKYSSVDDFDHGSPTRGQDSTTTDKIVRLNIPFKDQKSQLCSMPAMLKANERCYKRTFRLYGLEALNHRSELKMLWDTF